jgi:SAM-dependent methyltransferase
MEQETGSKQVASMSTNDLRAQYYDAYMANYQEDLPYWLNLAERYPGPVLELGCGSGRVARALLQAGHAYTGLDSDPAMLALCRAQWHGSTPPGTFVDADMTGFRLKQQFSLIISPCNTYSTLDAGQRAATLQGIRTHLSPRGCFAACLPNPHALVEVPPIGDVEHEDDLTHPQTGNPVQVLTAYERREDWFELHWHFDHLFPDGHIERTTISTNHAITTRQEYLSELKQAGFVIESLYGDFNLKPFNPGSPALLWEALQPG